MQLTGGLPQRFADEMGALLGPDFPKEIGLAVSGGGDSMAMLHLASGWARVFGVRLRVVTIDHGLRDASAAEAAMVADEAAGLGLSHDVLPWKWNGQGNLQDAARNARLQLIDGWRGDCRHVLFAHTQDDQAETLLMRLARGSGVDGLSAMTPMRDAGGWFVVRPLLQTRRAELRHYLSTVKIPFVDDPTNEDETFARVRMRKLIGSEGLDVSTLAETASRQQDAKIALQRRAFEAAQELQIKAPETLGSVVLHRDGFAKLDKETQMRLLAAGLQHVSRNEYRPRYAPLNDLRERVLAGGTGTLHGGQVSGKADRIYIFRELKAIENLRVDLERDTVWDGRFQVSNPDIKGLHVAALSDFGYRQISPKPKTGLPLPMILAFPCLWKADTLVACAPLGFGPAYDVNLKRSVLNFPNSLLTH